jgi:hypothetical protein
MIQINLSSAIAFPRLSPNSDRWFPCTFAAGQNVEGASLRAVAKEIFFKNTKE